MFFEIKLGLIQVFTICVLEVIQGRNPIREIRAFEDLQIFSMFLIFNGGFKVSDVAQGLSPIKEIRVFKDQVENSFKFSQCLMVVTKKRISEVVLGLG